jgi:hypothetical protein
MRSVKPRVVTLLALALAGRAASAGQRETAKPTAEPTPAKSAELGRVARWHVDLRVRKTPALRAIHEQAVRRRQVSGMDDESRARANTPGDVERAAVAAQGKLRMSARSRRALAELARQEADAMGKQEKAARDQDLGDGFRPLGMERYWKMWDAEEFFNPDNAQRAREALDNAAFWRQIADALAPKQPQ